MNIDSNQQSSKFRENVLSNVESKTEVIKTKTVKTLDTPNFKQTLMN